VTDAEQLWVPLVDEPIGSIVERIQAEDTAIEALVGSPRKLLAFRTFAYIRVGILLGRLLLEHDVPDYDGSETWVDALLRDPAHREAVAAEVRAVAEEIARDEAYADEVAVPDAAARERFREFARRRLA
jgi:hypothetical protein